MNILLVFRWVLAILISYILGKLISKFRLPSLLGWLIGGMMLGPYGFNLLNITLIEKNWYVGIMKVMECFVGFMIGTELVVKKLKRSGKALVITTIVQSLGTYIFVALIFGITFFIMKLPMYLAFIFGGIALATAPAPALSIVQEFKTKGPVTDALIPMAALDDIVGVICFFSTISIIVRHLSGGSMPFYMVPVMIFLPLIIGAFTGVFAGYLLRRARKDYMLLTILILFFVLTTFVGHIFNVYVLPFPVLNFMLMGMSFSSVIANMVREDKLEEINHLFRPILLVSLLVCIINLGVPLDYKLIFGAGLFTLIYIISRAIGKYFGARIGAKITKMPDSVQKYLGLTLLPHSGVSLIFTSISVNSIMKFDPKHAVIIQGTISAAAIINEVIAVIVAKKGFEWAGEIGRK